MGLSTLQGPARRGTSTVCARVCVCMYVFLCVFICMKVYACACVHACVRVMCVHLCAIVLHAILIMNVCLHFVVIDGSNGGFVQANAITKAFRG